MPDWQVEPAVGPITADAAVFAAVYPATSAAAVGVLLRRLLAPLVHVQPQGPVELAHDTEAGSRPNPSTYGRFSGACSLASCALA